jgi:hypothetical protein
VCNIDTLTAIKGKRPELLQKGVPILHGKTWRHSTMATQKFLQRFQWTILVHLAYSPGLASSDCHLFPVLKEYLEGHGFQSDYDVETAVER